MNYRHQAEDKSLIQVVTFFSENNIKQQNFQTFSTVNLKSH